MRHTDLYIQQMVSCTKSKLAAASSRLRSLETAGAYTQFVVVQSHVKALQVWLFTLSNWVNRDNTYNRITENELSNVIEEVLRLPYNCLLASEPVPVPQNQAPTVNAGIDQTLSASAVVATLSAIASDPEGGILTIEWTKLSGPNVTILTPGALTTGLANMQTGVYQFKVKVTDVGGLSAEDTIQITIPQALDTIYWGRSNQLNAPTQGFILSGTSFQFDGAQDVPVPWFDGATGPEYCWVAIPNRTAAHFKNRWFVDILNNGTIGLATDLFSSPATGTVNTVEYLMWQTQYPTQFFATCFFKKVEL